MGALSVPREHEAWQLPFLTLLSSSFCQLLPGKAGTGILKHPRGRAGQTPTRDSPGPRCPELTQLHCPPAALTLTSAHPFSPMGLSPQQLLSIPSVWGRAAQSPRGHVLQAETSRDLQGKLPRSSHGWEQQQQENAPELFLKGNPRQRFTTGMYCPESGASPEAAG